MNNHNIYQNTLYTEQSLYRPQYVGYGRDRGIDAISPSGTMVPKRTLGEKIAWAILTLVSLVLVVEIAFFWQDGAFDRAADNISYHREVAATEQYFAAHKGEPSGYVIGQEQGQTVSYGLAIAMQDESVEDETLMPYANSQLSYIPDYIKQKFLDDGWKIEITSLDLTGQYLSQDEEHQVYTINEGETVMGLTVPAESTIYIADTAYSVKQSAVHEMGHYVDRALGHLSDTDAFRFAMEKDAITYRFYFPYSHLDDEQEFFAETFQAYWKHPDELQRLCPDIYNYFTARF